MTGEEPISAFARLWGWTSAGKAGRWYFITIGPPTSDDLHAAARAGPWLTGRSAFGSVKVLVEIGNSKWSTSLFPHKESGGWILPVKAEIRKAEALQEGDEVSFTIRL